LPGASLPPGAWVDDAAQPRHLKITGAAPAFGFERCEDVNCRVEIDGTATSCGRIACPVCGCGGTNLSTIALFENAAGMRVRCSCGYSWMREEQFTPRRASLGVAD